MLRLKNSLYFFLFLLIIVGCNNNSAVNEYQDIEQSVFELINEHRIGQGLSELEWSDIVAHQARLHSENMAEGLVDFGHDGFSQRIEEIRREIPVVSAAENVACNTGFSDPAQSAVNSWLGSSGHRTNIEGDYTLTGVGVSKSNEEVYYFTQIFIK